MENLFELKHLNKTFGSGVDQVNALQDVTLSIEQGDIFGIIGGPSDFQTVLTKTHSVQNARLYSRDTRSITCISTVFATFLDSHYCA